MKAINSDYRKSKGDIDRMTTVSDDQKARSGFRWSPRESAWQRHLNEAGRVAARIVVERIVEASQPKEAVS